MWRKGQPTAVWWFLSDFPTKCALSVCFFYLFIIFVRWNVSTAVLFYKYFQTKHWIQYCTALSCNDEIFIHTQNKILLDQLILVHAEDPVLKCWRVNILIFTAWAVNWSLEVWFILSSVKTFSSLLLPRECCFGWLFPCFNHIPYLSRVENEAFHFGYKLFSTFPIGTGLVLDTISNTMRTNWKRRRMYNTDVPLYLGTVRSSCVIQKHRIWISSGRASRTAWKRK